MEEYQKLLTQLSCFRDSENAEELSKTRKVLENFKKLLIQRFENQSQTIAHYQFQKKWYQNINYVTTPPESHFPTLFTPQHETFS